jgi:hypothetical protein
MQQEDVDGGDKPGHDELPDLEPSASAKIVFPQPGE